MKSKRGRLDRFIAKSINIKLKDVRLLLAKQRILVNGQLASDIAEQIDEFSHITLDGQVLQANVPVYLMLHKPIGVVSATCDKQHKTVIDLLNHPQKKQLHLAGRLDVNSSGLMLLTNDGRWSRALSSPENHVPKVYSVTLEKPLSHDYVIEFAKGMYFSYEDVHIQGAELKIIGDYEAEVTLVEGRYHQIKRMFGRFDNRVVKLHRHTIGNIRLDADLCPGQSKLLTAQESASVLEHSVKS